MKIRRFKVGDKVKIAKDLSIGGYRYVEERMLDYAGKEAEIIAVISETDPIVFLLDVDNARFYWCSDTLSFKD